MEHTIETLMTPGRKDSIESYLRTIAKDKVEVEAIGNEWTAFTTEIGMYRIMDRYGFDTVKSHGYSPNLSTYYVSFENE